MSQQLVRKSPVLPSTVSLHETSEEPRETPEHHSIKDNLLEERTLFHWFQERAFFSIKRLMDIAVSLILLAFVAPVMVLISAAIRISSPGPAIYCQKRLTDGGKTFTMFKFRTMATDAEARSGAVWAGDKDPRVITIGRFLRKTRLDELPQLLNVLVGDMSMVGPRPERPEIAKDLAVKLPCFYHRLKVKAGLTGLAQVGPGYASCVDTYREKLAWDILYVRRKSILLDLKILFKTVWVVISGHGAR